MAMNVTLLEHTERESVGVTACEPRVLKRRRGQRCQILAGHAVGEGRTTTRVCAVLETLRSQMSPLAAPPETPADSVTVPRAAPRCTPRPPPQQPATLDLFERWGDTNGGQRQVSHRDPLPEPLLAYSRRGRIAHRQFRDFVVPARPLHRRWRRGRGPIARRPAGRTKRGSSGRGDRSSQAPGPGRAVQQERRGAQSGREPVDRSSLDRAYRTYLPARPAHPRHLRRPPPRRPTPGPDAYRPTAPPPTGSTAYPPSPSAGPTYLLSRTPPAEPHPPPALRPPGSPPIGPMPTGPTR